MKAGRLVRHRDISKDGFSSLQRVIQFCCSSCGLCAAICPAGAIEIRQNVPTLTGQCTLCGLCYQGCPRSFYPQTLIHQRYFGPERNELEKRVGRFCDRFTSRALNDDIFEQGATGGTTTALVHYLLDNHIIDAVLHLGCVHADNYICHHGKAIISTAPDEVLNACRSKCQINPLLHELRTIATKGRYAVVGLACHVQALRKLQALYSDRELREQFPAMATVAERLLKNLAFVIGVNCFSNTRYQGIDKIYQKLGVREEDVIKHAETTKKSVYQHLSEGKNFLWFVQDGVMTRDGVYHPFSYTDFIAETVSMGCMVCPSFIVCKEADVSIGVTASDTRLNEFGYNSVFVRCAELSEIFANMVKEGKLLRRPMWDNRGKLLRTFVERMIPSKDVIGLHDYVKTGRWNTSRDSLKSSSSAQGGSSGKIMGLQRLMLTQTVKRKIMYQPAVNALRMNDKFLTDII